MKCPYCGADVKKGLTVCEYCNSDLSANAGTNVNINIHNHYGPDDRAERARRTRKTVVTIVVVLVVLFVVIPTVIGFAVAIGLLNKEFDSYYGEKESRISGLANETVTVKEYSGGTVSFTYLSGSYSNVKILDEELIGWLDKEGKTLKNAEILFSTDKDGNITSIAMKSAPFIVIDEENDRYTACCEDRIFEFTSYKELDTGVVYDGYFSYPDVYLAKADEAVAFVGAMYDPKCSGKEIKTVRDAYTGKELTMYRIRCGGSWYYCSQDIYDAAEEGGSLDGYLFLDEPPCVLIE